MNIDLHKLINNLDEIKIEVGPFGGRSLRYEGIDFKMNAFVKNLIEAKEPLSYPVFKKIEKLNHALPDNLTFVQRILTAIRQFFGNLSYNRDKELFSYSLSCRGIVSDTKPKFKEKPLIQAPLANDYDNPKRTLKPLPVENSLRIVIVPKERKIKFVKNESKKNELKKAELKPAAPPSAASLEAPATDARPKLSRTKSFKLVDTLSLLKEKCEIEDFSLLNFSKEVKAKLDVPDKDYENKLNKVIEELCGEPIFKWDTSDKERAKKTYIAFTKPECVKIIQYVIIRLMSTGDFVFYSRLIENLFRHFSIETVKAILEAYANYIVKERNFYPDKKDETFKFLMDRYTDLCKANPDNKGMLNKEHIVLGIGCTILKDSIEPGWVEELVNRYKTDKEFLTKLDEFLKTHLKSNERRTILNKIAEHLSSC